MLAIKSLNVSYGSHKVLQDVDLNVSPGEVHALIGPNGAGKTTLIRAISGVLGIQSGSIYCNGQDLTILSNAERARILAVVPQARQTGGAFTVEQTVLLGRTAYMSWFGKPRPEDHAAVKMAMQHTAIEHLAGRRNAELSGGEQQRVLLARALAQQTNILLLDEPTSHLDMQHRTSLLSLVRALADRENLVVLMAMHDLNQVSMYSDRVSLLVDGRLNAVGTPLEVLTVDNIREAYQTPVQIIQHPDHKIPLILPVRDSLT